MELESRKEPVSYANMLNDNSDNPKVKLRTMESDVPIEANFDVRILIALGKRAEHGLKTRLDGPTPDRNVWSTSGHSLESWGRSSYAKAMIEIDAHKNYRRNYLELL
uniref:Uncharacterized protein n=1 Tax=Tanacetum cinerariifolium TaxID=118510 RepID=A0A699HJT5_TANCI|nr:hypothetical protein [Tanacetum cinerariifolium]